MCGYNIICRTRFIIISLAYPTHNYASSNARKRRLYLCAFMMLRDSTAFNIFLFTAHYLIVNLLPICRLVFLRSKGLRRTLLPLLSMHVLCHLELVSLKGPSLVNKIQVISSWYLVIFFLVRILTSWFGLCHTGLMWEGYGTCACSIMLCFWRKDTFCMLWEVASRFSGFGLDGRVSGFQM